MNENARYLTRVGNFRRTRVGFQKACITHLPTAFGVERCLVQNDANVVAGEFVI